MTEVAAFVAEGVRDEVRDRLALGEQWLGYALEAPLVFEGARLQTRAELAADLKAPIARALVRFFVEATQGVPLDELGRYVKRSEEGEALPVVSWLAFESVRAVWLAVKLRRAGVTV